MIMVFYLLRNKTNIEEIGRPDGDDRYIRDKYVLRQPYLEDVYMSHPHN
jgi:hypothetical protein